MNCKEEIILQKLPQRGSRQTSEGMLHLIIKRKGKDEEKK